MPLMAPLQPVAPAIATRFGEIPPDLASFLADAPTHPALFRLLPAPPTAAELTEAALTLAAVAGRYAEAAGPAGPLRLPANSRGVIHRIGRSGVLHLPASPVTRAVSLSYGELTERRSPIPVLRPGVVRLIPAYREVILAELAGQAALAVEIAL